jgi:hypothetical protein
MDVRTYHGSGSLRYVENQIDCTFTLAQSSDGDVRLECTTPPSMSPPAHWMAGLFGPMPVPEMFEGRLQDGRPVQVHGGFLAFPGGWSRAEGAKAFFELNGSGAEAVVGTVAGADERGEWHFGITNLLLDSGQWNGQVGSREVAWTIDRLNVRVRDLTTEASRRLFGGKQHTDVTAHVELPGTLTLADAREIAADLCSVLSIAQGTMIGCIYVECVSQPDDVAFACHYPAVTRPHNGALPLIDPNEESDLTRFVEEVSVTFRRKEAERGLRVLARAIADVRTTGFLETRALQVSSLIEFIVSRDADINQSAFIIDAKAFGKKEKSVKAALQASLAAVLPDTEEAKLKTMCRHVPALNRVPFIDLLAATSSSLGAKIPAEDFRSFIATRNALVHRGTFATKSPWDEFRLMLSIVDRLILALLEYRGPYVDARVLKRVEPEPRS